MIKTINKQQSNEKKLLPTHATSDLGNGLNLKMVLYLIDLANPKIGLI